MIAYLPTPLIVRLVKDVPWSGSLIFIFHVFFVSVEKQTNALRIPRLWTHAKSTLKICIVF